MQVLFVVVFLSIGIFIVGFGKKLLFNIIAFQSKVSNSGSGKGQLIQAQTNGNAQNRGKENIGGGGNAGNAVLAVLPNQAAAQKTDAGKYAYYQTGRVGIDNKADIAHITVGGNNGGYSSHKANQNMGTAAGLLGIAAALPAQQIANTASAEQTD